MTNEAKESLDYVRDVVQRSQGASHPASIYYLWALVCLVGFPLSDLAPRAVGTYWMIAAPVGFVLSAILGWRHALRVGQVSQREGIFTAYHWLATLVVAGMASLLVIQGLVGGETLGMIILLVLTMSYFSAGLYQARPLLYAAALLGLSFLAVVFIEQWAWTVAGVAVALGLFLSGRVGGHRA